MIRFALPLIACSLFACTSESPVDAGAKPEPKPCDLSTELDPEKPGSPGHKIKSARNPNGDSELAVVMRQCVDDLKEARRVMESGGKPKPMYASHRLMRCSWPTKPSVRDEMFDSMAVSYLDTVKAFDGTPNKDSFNGILNSCIACHQQTCGGVIDMIDGLRWE